MQLVELLYLASVGNAPYSYFGYLNAMSATTFAFLPNLPKAILSSDMIKEYSEDNILPRPFSYHRYLKSKAFITNIGNVLSYYVILGVYALLCVLLKSKIRLFNSKLKGITIILNQSVIVHFTQVILAACLHLKYVLSNATL